jgi:hypothetical protein
MINRFSWFFPGFSALVLTLAMLAGLLIHSIKM